jgi:hypothetical protein
MISMNLALARARRLVSAVWETYARSGLFAATVFLWRSLHQKAPLLWRQLAAVRHARTIRAGLRQRRAALTPARPLVAVAVIGGVGDYIVIARFLRDLAASGGDMLFNVFSPAPTRAAWIFAAVPGFNQAYHDILFGPLLAEHDLALKASQMVAVREEFVRWQELRQPELQRIINTLIGARPQVAVFIDHDPFLDNALARQAVATGRTRRDFMHHIAGIPYGGDSLAVPADQTAAARMGLRPGGYVTVHNGFDPGFVISGNRATKCYPHFEAVVAILKQALPHLLFVQVGAGDPSELLSQCDVDLVGRTTLKEVAGVLAQTAFHIDNESGLVHLARCYGVRSAVVFGPTPSDYFAYPENLSIEPPVCGDCWWLTRTWMDSCAKGYPTPRCMTEQKPEEVARQILRWVEEELVFEPASADQKRAACASP